MSAADILTIHDRISLIMQLLTPGKPGCPRHIIVSGDQPTYRMIVKIWRNSYLQERQRSSEYSHAHDLKIHEWLIPFPGFFHIEKQSLYPLCKEMLHGMGLSELAGCCGFSESRIENILKHSHARNNRALIFSLCTSLLIHTSDIILAEHPELRDEVEAIARVSCNSLDFISAPKSKLLTCTTGKVTFSTIAIGRALRKKVAASFDESPNGRHIIRTLFFTCFLPVVGFHILSRTGHSDVVDSFWLRLNNILHTSGHLNYQQLYMFYGFLRGTVPRVVFHDLYTDKPGGMMARVPSFTSGRGSIYDSRGWTYVHLDEALEMVIVRLLKSLNVTMLPYLESSGAWLLTVSHARMLIRTITAASRAYQRVRGDGDKDGDICPLHSYDKSAVQSSSVRNMVNLRRSKGFLSVDHRNCERLKNVFRESANELTSHVAQNLILDIESHGRKTVELHTSAMFPEVFGPLSTGDIDQHLNKRRPKGDWTKQRQIRTVGTALAAQEQKTTTRDKTTAKDPKAALSERRHAMKKLMTSLTVAEHKSIEAGDTCGAENA